ncbi:MAG: hypothetical protein D6798_02750 [Deltaproteobacteria bacterium]|nr:MAG: hypothetical protein D6798_02750 [Deltaproteobacteria bacterium]
MMAPLLLLVLVACTHGGSAGGGPASTGGADGGNGASTTTVTLTVEGGFGGGRYAPGDRVRVWADVDPHAAIVTGWTGDASLLDHPADWNSGLAMPDRDVTLSPVLATVPFEIGTRSGELAGEARSWSQVLPAEPRGIVLFFHGARYSRAELTDAAATSIGMRLVAAGYGVVALDSSAAADSGTGGWNPSESGPDMAAVRDLVSLLRADLGDLPVYAWGMSSGGQFAHAVGRSLPADGVLASCAPGTSDIAATTTAPTAWFMAGADTTFPSGAEDARTYAGKLAARGLPAEVHVHPPTPLYDARFTRVPGIDAARSTEIADWIRSRGYVDDRGDWLVSGGTVSGALDLADLDAATVTAIAAEIEIMAADHELYDDYSAEMVAFLDGLADR